MSQICQYLNWVFTQQCNIYLKHLPLLRNAIFDRRVINPVKTIHKYRLLLYFRGIVCTDAQPTNKTSTIQTARYTNIIIPFVF